MPFESMGTTAGPSDGYDDDAYDDDEDYYSPPPRRRWGMRRQPRQPAAPRARRVGGVAWPSPFNVLMFLAAVGGVTFGVYVVRIGAKPVPVAQPVVQPSRPPFAHYIAGAGIVESAGENISISTPVPGMVTDVPVHIGQQVKAGDLLFKIDARDLEAELVVREAAAAEARSRVPEAQSNLDDAQQMYDSYKAVIGNGAVTREEFNRRRFGLAGAQSRVDQANAAIVSADAQVTETRMELSRRRVTAPNDGEVIQLKIHPGEYAQVGPLSTPLMVIGQTRTLHVRTNIDENDAWRFVRDSRAIAYVRGNPGLSTPLKFVYVEPYVIPKASVTGDPGERVDTRVLQVLFAFDPNRLNVFVGQQMDVYIEAKGTEPATTAPTVADPGATDTVKPADPDAEGAGTPAS
jgi:multidrug efflux pump subunit AcrA (membrane-fusion protein)